MDNTAAIDMYVQIQAAQHMLITAFVQAKHVELERCCDFPAYAITAMSTRGGTLCIFCVIHADKVPSIATLWLKSLLQTQVSQALHTLTLICSTAVHIRDVCIKHSTEFQLQLSYIDLLHMQSRCNKLLFIATFNWLDPSWIRAFAVST